MDLMGQWVPVDGETVGETVRIEFQREGTRLELDVEDVVDVAFERCDPVRSFPAWPGKRNYEGLCWMSRVGVSVPFESLAERACLIELDRLADVAAVASQPMWIRWDGSRPARHAPDYFVRRSDGRAVLIDVRPADRIDDAARAQFDRTARLSARLGWGYVVFDGSSPVREANLRFLMRYRDSRWNAPAVAPSTAVGTIGSLVEQLGGGDEGLAHCYALLWRGEVRVDLDVPLSLRSRIYATEE